MENYLKYAKIHRYLEEIKNLGEIYDDFMKCYDDTIENDLHIIIENVERTKKILKEIIYE